MEDNKGKTQFKKAAESHGVVFSIVSSRINFLASGEGIEAKPGAEVLQLTRAGEPWEWNLVSIGFPLSTIERNDDQPEAFDGISFCFLNEKSQADGQLDICLKVSHFHGTPWWSSD